jgi:hypothetical protein
VVAFWGLDDPDPLALDDPDPLALDDPDPLALDDPDPLALDDPDSWPWMTRVQGMRIVYNLPLPEN